MMRRDTIEMRALHSLICSLLTIFVTALLGACTKSSGANSTAPAPPEVNVAEVLERRVKDWDEFTGRLQAVETVEIRPRVSGYIDVVAFTEGKPVRRN
jgi:multidrug efflux pump subunit AcrA (membrane-fusion protein)